MNDDDFIKGFTYPIWAIAIEPVPRDSEGRPDVERATLMILDDPLKDPLWGIFRSKKLIEFTLSESHPDVKYLAIEIPTEKHFHYLLRHLHDTLGVPLRVLVDPDGNMQGFPLPPQNWPDIATA